MNTSPDIRFRHLLRLSISLVWLYQGIWHKLLAFDGKHQAIMEQALGTVWGKPAMYALGLGEALLGCGVALGFKPVPLAWLQTLLLVGMNTAGLVFAWSQIPDPGGMITLNLMFIIAIWTQAKWNTPPR